MFHDHWGRKRLFPRFWKPTVYFSWCCIFTVSKGFPYTGTEFYSMKAVKISQDGDLSRCNKKGGWEKAGGLTYSWKFKLELTVVTKWQREVLVCSSLEWQREDHCTTVLKYWSQCQWISHAATTFHTFSCFRTISGTHWIWSRWKFRRASN